MKKIQVLLATYNGENFISDQIYSVLLNFNKMNDFDCSILISDDQSTDNTINIVNNIKSKDPRVVLIDNERKGGVKNNFNYLIGKADADYIFFCDQDDFWLPDKISIFIEKFIELEGENKPLLIHSDLCVVDKTLSPLHTSMFEYQIIRREPSFSNLIVSNSITGCVLAINSPLLTMVKKSSVEKSIMHDWYIGLIASAFGTLYHIPKSLILYRQHDNNQVGAKAFGLRIFFDTGKVKKAFHSIYLTREQAILFNKDFGNYLSRDNHAVLNYFIESFSRGFIFRFFLFFKKDIVKFGIIRNAVFFILYVFFAKKALEE